MYRDLLKNRNFTLLALGGFISSIGDYIYNIGITVYLYTLTRSVGSIAIMWLSRAVLRIPLLYLSGIITDSCNRKKIIAFTNLISALVAFLFIYGNASRLWLIYLLAFMLQSLNDIDVSSENAILPELVPKEQLSYSNSIFSFLQSTSVFLSPALGGLLYKFCGNNILFIVNAASFLLSGILFSLISYNYKKPITISSKAGIFKSGLEGYNILLKYINVKTVFCIMSIFAVLGRFYETYKVAVCDTLLGMAPEGIIYFDYALAIGGLSVPFLIRLLKKHNNILIFTVSTIAISIGYIMFGYSHSFLLTFIILILLGVVQNIQGIYSNTIIQNSIPKEYLGRVFSFFKILLTLFAIIGLLIASPLYKLIGIGSSFLAVSIILFAVCVIQIKVWLRDKQDNSKFAAR